MTNQDQMALLLPIDFYAVMKWLTHEYGMRYPSTSHAIISWLGQEAHFGQWQEVHGYATPGGDPVYICPECGQDKHVFGIESPSNYRIICHHCGCWNVYSYRGKRADVAID